MVTSDIVVLSSDGWVPITCTGTVVHILSVKNSDLNVKFGSSGSSDGLTLNPGDTLSASETIYVKSRKPYLASTPAVVTVSKD